MRTVSYFEVVRVMFDPKELAGPYLSLERRGGHIRPQQFVGPYRGTSPIGKRAPP